MAMNDNIFGQAEIGPELGLDPARSIASSRASGPPP
jgi:hypothetical protein